MAKQKRPEFKKSRTTLLRMGFRLDSIFWPMDVMSIGQMLSKLGYKGIQTSPNGSLQATKTSADFYSDHLKMVFGFYASTIDSLVSAQKEFFSLAQNDYKANFYHYIRFFEFENALTYYTDNEKNSVSQIFTNSEDMRELSKLIGEDVSLWKIDISNKGAKSQDDDWFHIEIAPKSESAANSYLCKFLKRSKNHDEIVKVFRKSTELLENLASHIENKNK